MKTHLTFLIIFSFVSFNSLFSSNELSDGFIVHQSNDTIYGKIVVKSDIDLHASLEFKGVDGNIFNFSPKEIKAFYIESDNRLFESKCVKSGDVYDCFFMRCLVKGYISFYLIRHERANRFFLEKEDKLVELVNSVTQRRINSKTYNLYGYEYVSTIKLNFLTDCPEMQSSADELKFNEKDILSFVEQLNICNNKGIPTKIYISSNKVIKNNGISVGFGKNTSYPAKGLSFGVGFSQELRKPELSRNLYLSYGLDFNYGIKVSDDQYLESYSLIALPLNVNLEFGKSKVQPYISGGFQLLTYIRKLKPMLWQTKDNDTLTVFPLNLGCGLKTKRVNIFFSYNIFDTRVKFIYYLNKGGN